MPTIKTNAPAVSVSVFRTARLQSGGGVLLASACAFVLVRFDRRRNQRASPPMIKRRKISPYKSVKRCCCIEIHSRLGLPPGYADGNGFFRKPRRYKSHPRREY